MTVEEARTIVAEGRATSFKGQDFALVCFKSLEAGCLTQRLGAMGRDADLPPKLERRVHAL